MITLEFLRIEEGVVYTVDATLETVVAIIKENLVDGVVMVGIAEE